MAVTRGQLWRQARDRLSAAGIDTAALDARVLLQHCLGIDQTQLIASEAETVSELTAYEALIARRLAREPVARIIGRQEFYGFDFGLNEATLVPRPETEMLVDFGVTFLKGRPSVRVLDLGTGTGCIALSILGHVPGAMGVGVDLSPLAVSQAVANASALGLAERFDVRQGDWFAPVAGERFDLVVSNPPYIASAAMAGLAPEVGLHDPALALDGGNDGLEPYRIITRLAGNHLVPGAALAVEIGFDQGGAVAGMFNDAGLIGVRVEKDLAGHDRMVVGHIRSDAVSR